MKRLHFAGYDFASGSGGTVIFRPGPAPTNLRKGDRVRYKGLPIGIGTYRGTVETIESQKWCHVRWDRKQILSQEWTANLVGVTE